MAPVARTGTFSSLSLLLHYWHCIANGRSRPTDLYSTGVPALAFRLCSQHHIPLRAILLHTMYTAPCIPLFTLPQFLERVRHSPHDYANARHHRTWITGVNHSQHPPLLVCTVRHILGWTNLDWIERCVSFLSLFYHHPHGTNGQVTAKGAAVNNSPPFSSFGFRLDTPMHEAH